MCIDEIIDSIYEACMIRIFTEKYGLVILDKESLDIWPYRSLNLNP